MRQSKPLIVTLTALCVSLSPSISQATYVTCLPNSQTKQAAMVTNNTAWAIATSQANNTWDDWVWRGPIYYCSATGSDLCNYTWGKSSTVGYDFSVGGGIGDLGDIPTLGTVLGLFKLEGDYGYNKSWTESFSWSQQISGGWFAQPVMVVRRRWTAGVFQGAFYKTNSSCVASDGSGSDFNVDDGSPGWYYWWNGNARFGSWTGNLQVSKFAMYYVYK